MNFSFGNFRHWAAMRTDHPLWLSAVATILLALVPTVMAAQGNSIVVESKTVLPGQDSVWVAVWLENTAEIDLLYVVLEIRSTMNDAFPEPYATLTSNPAGRVEHSGLGSEEWPCYTYPWPNPAIFRVANPDTSENWCSGPISNTYSSDDGGPGFESPDGYLLVGVGNCGPLQPGSDSQSPDSASMRFLVDIPETPGVFEIDTCCIGGSHTTFIDEANQSQDSTIPSFTRGVITVCDCRCQSDPQCDSVTNVADVVMTIDRAFRNGDKVFDANCIGHLVGLVDGRTDNNCSGFTDVVDVVQLIDAAFRGGSLQLCNPCDSGAPRLAVYKPSI